MPSVTTKPDSSQPAAETAVYLFDNWFDPIEGGLRDRVLEFIHAMIEGELDVALSRPRYARHAKSPNGEAEGAVGATGHRHGHRSRSLLGSFGRVELEVPTVVEKINSRLGCRLRGIRLRGNVTPETTRPSIHTTPATAPAGMEVRCDD